MVPSARKRYSNCARLASQVLVWLSSALHGSDAGYRRNVASRSGESGTLGYNNAKSTVISGSRKTPPVLQYKEATRLYAIIICTCGKLVMLRLLCYSTGEAKQSQTSRPGERTHMEENDITLLRIEGEEVRRSIMHVGLRCKEEPPSD